MSPPMREAGEAKAEVYYGDQTCRQKFISLLAEMGLPDSLLLVPDIEECGYVKETGFVWLRHKKDKAYYRIEDKIVSYDSLITAYFEPHRIRNLTGVKARELLIWFNLIEICLDEDEDEEIQTTITFKTPFGFSRSFPLSCFAS